MARTLTLSIQGSSFELTPTKVDRSKLYGHTELRVVNYYGGGICTQASINSDGVNIICPGATKIGIVDQSGNWIEKQSLVPVTDEGITPQWIPSSFDEKISLNREATAEELLELNIQSVYFLTGEHVDHLKGVLKEKIYVFDFIYRGGYENSTAYLLANDSGVFMLTGIHGNYEYLGLDEIAELDNADDELDIEEMDLDFSMM